MRWRRFLAAALAGGPLAAQQPADTVRRKPAVMQEITVTASPARRSDPSNSQSLVPAVFRAVPALNPYDRLRQAAGLEVHDQGQGPGFASNASLRGFSSDHSTDLALWVDGVPINEPVNGHAEGYNDWSVMFPQAIRSVEVFNGPTSALFGNFALAGVVSVRTLERMRGAEGEVSGGGYGRVGGSVLGGWDHAGSGGVLGLRGLREAGWRRHSDYRLGQGHVRVLRDLGPSVSLDGGVELYAAGWDSPGFLTNEEFAARDYQVVSNPTDGGFKRRAQERLSLRVIGSSVIWRSTVYSTQSRWQIFLTTPPEGGITEGSGSQVEEEDRRYGLGATSALTWAGRRGELTVGAEGRFDHSDYENWFVTDRVRDSSETLVDASQTSGALFVQSLARLGSHLTLSAGGRADLLRASSTPKGESVATSDARAIVSPKVGLLVALPKFVDLYGNLSRGFRQTDGVIRDPALPFITAWAYEAGARLDRRTLAANAAVFRMEVSNEQSFDPISAQSTSGGASRRQGMEIGLDATPVPALHIRARWTFLDAKYKRLVTEEGDTLSGARVFNTAKYFGSAGVTVGPLSGRWSVSPTVTVVGPYTPFEAVGQTEPAYALFHLGGEVTLGRARIQVGLRNVFDRAYPELRAGDFVVPGQPRTVSAGVSYRFRAPMP